MRIAGIIAEYNPFHNGHAHQIRMLSQFHDVDGIIVCMSGCFTQRGEPALISKRARAVAAVMSGADLVIELPTLYATGSAEFFATGAVKLLNSLGCVDVLAFGMEDPDEITLVNAANRLMLLENSPDYHERIVALTKQGMTYPLARMRLMEQDGASKKELDLLHAPNDLLAVEYVKALHNLRSPIRPLPIARCGQGYHDEHLLDGSDPSAKAIREYARRSNRQEAKKMLASFIPEESLDSVFSEHFVFPDAFSAELHYQLLMHEREGYAGFLDVSEDHSDRIKKLLPGYRDWESFAALIKSKDITATRISRMFTHILLGIRKDPFFGIAKRLEIPYAHILAMDTSSPVMHRLKGSPLHRFNNPYTFAKQVTDETEKTLLELDLLAEKLYLLKKNRS